MIFLTEVLCPRSCSLLAAYGNAHRRPGSGIESCQGSNRESRVVSLWAFWSMVSCPTGLSCRFPHLFPLLPSDICRSKSNLVIFYSIGSVRCSANVYGLHLSTNEAHKCDNAAYSCGFKAKVRLNPGCEAGAWHDTPCRDLEKLSIFLHFFILQHWSHGKLHYIHFTGMYIV